MVIIQCNYLDKNKNGKSKSKVKKTNYTNILK